MRLCLFILSFLSLASQLCAQEESGIGVELEAPATFMLKGEVVDMETDQPIDKVNVEIAGKEYTTTNRAGEFSIRASVGDELIFRSDAFETVYYQVVDRQRVMVRAEPIPTLASTEKKLAEQASNPLGFETAIDSAKAYLRSDAGRSIEFVTLALESIQGGGDDDRNAIAFSTLGDINAFWGQNDLAISNYKRSLEYAEDKAVRIKLADNFRQNGNYQESIGEFERLLDLELSPYQQIEVYEGLGDVYASISDPLQSLKNYQLGLRIANSRQITPKITDLNSKIAESYAQEGKLEEAITFFDNSLDLAGRENTRRSAAEKNRVADFYNSNQNFDKEIQLRQEALDDIEEIGDSIIDANGINPLTVQNQNYKIANAYVAQDKYDEAIPFLEKSISEADQKQDLIVQKDATRKLSEIYRDLGDLDKAAQTYQQYVSVVDELYIQKEQELSQAARFNREITLRQNRIISLENERELNESRYQLAVDNQELIQKNNRIQKWIIGSLVVIALLLLYTAFTQRKTARQQRYANDLLALKSLRTQMNPHFIFNALNSVNSYIAQSDERAANRYLSEFSQLMRAVLENSEEDFIPLAKEIELLQLYVKLEHFRFTDKFDYHFEVDPNLQVDQFVIPPMLLQPYVENAVWHGLRYKEEKGNLLIRFRQLDTERVEVLIQDDGIGREHSKALKTDHQKKQNSKGMGNIKKRIAILNTMYSDKVDVSISDLESDGRGTQVTLILKKD
ncbi:histidine kinase [Aureitalea marina]|uniref:Sensor histidine kinase n=1 Tax=Aureitalea marina TaxID=930804 RepID=A0A2S7KR76_9FLAO|nr:histidine kinase [Aureitalea marina]PQB05126.1 sensor histidine kinase [Aureitalea marina]